MTKLIPCLFFKWSVQLKSDLIELEGKQSGQVGDFQWNSVFSCLSSRDDFGSVKFHDNKSLVSHVAARCAKPQTKCVNKQQSSQNLLPACCDPGPVQILDTGAWHWLGGCLIDERARRGIDTFTHCLEARPEAGNQSSLLTIEEHETGYGV